MQKRFISYDFKGVITGAVLGLHSILLCVSCSKEFLPAEQAVIQWDISSSDLQATKALIGTYTDLRDACTQDEDGAEKIGVFGAYTYEGTTEHIFEDADLWWWEKENGNPFNDPLGDQSYWNYEGEGKYWVDGSDYRFRAYYPKSKVVLQPGSDVDKFLVVYDSQLVQYDMMVASRNLKAASENPVKLIFSHALAAIRFNYIFAESGVSDKLTACWLENAEATGFYTSSTLNYESSILWPESTPNPIGSRMYYWSPINPMTMTSGTAATAYKSSATAGKGDIYTDNDGWILIIPQTLKGPESLKLCFTTETGGSEVFSVGLPAVELNPGYRHTFNIKISSTSIDLKLTIADWNERDSHHHIDFNE